MKPVRFLYPADPLAPRRIDEMFAPEAAALREAGFATSAIELEALPTGRPRLTPSIVSGEQAVYRGWMLTVEEYTALLVFVESLGGDPLTSADTYLLAHHLPRWYSLLRDLTPETVVLSLKDDLPARLAALGWERFFVKDYVKSLKTSIGSLIDRPEDVGAVVAALETYRGQIEGGICVRRFEPLVPETERRFFVLGGLSWANDPAAEIPEPVATCAARIASPFFSVDFALREDGIERIVEIGDGQVSDLVGWSPERFAEMWRALPGTGKAAEARVL